MFIDYILFFDQYYHQTLVEQKIPYHYLKYKIMGPGVCRREKSHAYTLRYKENKQITMIIGIYTYIPTVVVICIMFSFAQNKGRGYSVWYCIRNN